MNLLSERCVLFFLLVLLSGCGVSDDNQEKPGFKSSKIASFLIGTADGSGAYSAFGEKLKTVLSSDTLIINVRNTQGSVDNLNLIKNREIDAAIVQNDVAYNTYKSKGGSKNRSFKSGLPLFHEYIFLIVDKNSYVHELFDLKGAVWVGGLKSGTRVNAIKILDEAGLRHFVKLPDKLPCEFPACLSNGDIQAAFFMMASPPDWYDKKKHRIIALPSSILKNLQEKSPYYLKSSFPPGVNLPEGETLTVTAYLVIGNHVKTYDAEILTSAMIEHHKELKSADAVYNLLDLKKKFISKFPVKRHPGVKKALIKSGLIENTNNILWWFLFAPLSIGLLWWSHKHSIAYDMLGCQKKTNNILGWFLKKVNNLYIHVIIVVIAISVFASTLWLARYYEEKYTIENNVSSAFSDISFSDALLWMFVFTGTGNTDDKFPESAPGKVLVTIFPLIGYMSLIGLALATYYKRRQVTIEKNRGNYVAPHQDHVLICGWNEKAPGIIYGLTCKDAPVKRKIVVIAELGNDMPLADYNFDYRYVSYCNGDSANYGVLEKAYANFAAEAIILAGFEKRKTKNIRSILTALALKPKKFNGSHSMPFVITELLYKENLKRFDAVNTDAILDTEVFSNRLVSSCCLGGDVVDFVLDILTHDEYSEIYVLPAEVTVNTSLKGLIRHKYFGKSEEFSWAGWGLADFQLHMLKQGINVIGVNNAGINSAESRMVGLTFDEQVNLKLVFENPDYVIQKDDQILFLAKDESKFTSIKLNSYDADLKFDKSSKNSLIKNTENPARFIPENIQVLVIGSWNRCKNIKDEFSEIEYVSLSLMAVDASDKEESVYCLDPEVEETWNEISVNQFDRVVILANDSEYVETDILSDQGELDAPTLFVANILRASIEMQKHDKKPKIIAEMVNYNYRHLFDNCVDIVIPTTIFIERLLIKGIYHHGVIGNFLSGLLAERDGTYLLSHKVESENDFFFGETLNELFSHCEKSIQVIGYYPSGRKEFIKQGADFQKHFVISPKELPEQTIASIGDVVIIIYSPDKILATFSLTAQSRPTPPARPPKR